MAFWNSNAIFNRKGNESGFTWNSKKFLFIVRLHDTLRLVDNVSEILARLVLDERRTDFYDTLVNTAFFGKVIEEFTMFDENPSVSLLISMMENLGIKDEFTDYVVLMYLNENVKVLDQLKLLVEILESEDFDLKEITNIRAFMQMLDKFKLEDIKMTFFNWLYLHDRFGLSDHNPRQAISDFLIGNVDQSDKAYDWLEPFGGLRVDWANTNLSIMPEVEFSEITMPGVDGSIIGDTTYKDRLFEIQTYSVDGLTVSEKEELKRRITQVLDSTKNTAKKLTVQARGITFEAKVEGEQEIKDGPSFVAANIKFRVPPYGKDLFPRELTTSGLIDNSEGLAPLKPKITITGPVTRPSFRLGGTTYQYTKTVPSATRLIIDFEKYTVYLEDNFGHRTNALKDFTGEFISIPPGDSMALVVNSSAANHFLCEWYISLLW